ncbi:MAG: WD40 repeat domain-containing protein [Granulosicoccus sp.]
MNMDAYPLADQGLLQVAPGMLCTEVSVGANVTHIALGRKRLIAGLGDGRLIQYSEDGLQLLAQHQGAITGVRLLKGGDIVCAGQDGHLRLITDNESRVLLKSDETWIDAMAVSVDGILVAAAIGKTVSVFSNGELIASFSDHPSTVSGLSFFTDGKKIAVSHYNGVSVWSLTDMTKPRRLHWAGSVVSVSVSPDQRYIASATQDREIHLWDLVTERDFRLGGYQRKVKSIGWSTDSATCISSGADVVVGWKMAADPGALPPVEIGYAYAYTVSLVSAIADPSRIVAGFSDGSIQIGECSGGTARIARPGGGAEITALDAPAGSSVIAFGTACGLLGSVDVPG